MILSHPTFSEGISLDGDEINILVVENPKQLSNYVQELNSQIQGRDGSFSLYFNDELEELKNNVKLIIDPFNLEINTKDVMNQVLSKLGTISLDQDHYQHTMTILESVFCTISEICQELDISLENKELTFQSLLKIAGIEFIQSNDSLVENICDYLDVISKYTKIKLFIFVNIRDFLTNADLLFLEKHILYEKESVLFLESREHEINDDESVVIIDSDLCEIRMGGIR